LSDLGAEIKVSYDLESTRLHAKSWIFHRDSNLSTAYVGSSNLTHQAQVTGLEWNVRLSGRRNASAIEKLATVFESYWNSGDFADYDPAQFRDHMRADERTKQSVIPNFELSPHPFQRRMLEQLSTARAAGQHKNLVVAATGTGKTVLSAFDYKEIMKQHLHSRLLFVAHRQEILEQSLNTFRAVLRDPLFGELWVGGERPREFHHVFASIQSLSASGLDMIDPTQFDVVIVDEFHHAAADTYRILLEHLQPRELIGLTATPERADGQSILGWFDDRIAVELRLWDAIDQQRLVPFLYFGVDDGTDLGSVPFRSRRYDTSELETIYTVDTSWVRRVLQEVDRLVPDVTAMTALGFCASVNHAEFTASAFTQSGIPAAVLSGSTPAAERARILQDLRAGRLRAVFSVDVLSEGVDIPQVDTIFLMRPTESATVFLQQLGRGLRKFEGKGSCLVLDFIGHQSSEFRFDLKYRALLGVSRQGLQRQVHDGFQYLPVGCQMVLEPKPASRVLESLANSIPSKWPLQVAELMRMAREEDPTFSEYLLETGLEPSDIYRDERSWMGLREAASLSVPESGPDTPSLTKAIARLLHIDDGERLTQYIEWLSKEVAPSPTHERQRRLLRMLVASLISSAAGLKALDIEQAASVVWGNSRVRMDLLTLCEQLHTDLQFNTSGVLPVRGMPDVPLCLHARYTRTEILCAFGANAGKVVPPSWQSGVMYVPGAKTDLFAINMDKSGDTFSPTTRYRDYAINESLFHWESQSSTRAMSETGQRYINHADRDSSVMLFARPDPSERAFWFLGPATYESHVGEQPMAITWRLVTPLPENLYNAIAAAVA
jgi:superfamily II DNA or RNA helicase